MHTSIRLAQENLEFFGHQILELRVAVLVLIVIVAAAIDMRVKRIPNWLVAFGSVFAVGFHVLSHDGEGAFFALAGMAAGAGAFLPLYAIGTMGAGDVKLMGTVGAFLGTSGVIEATLATLIAGGLLALIAAARKRMLFQLASNIRLMIVQRQIRHMCGESSVISLPPQSVGKMPYALAIAAGTFVQIFLMHA